MGGSSLVSVEKYPGGHKSIQNLGAFQDTYELKGTFLYKNALHKLNQINAMWYSGQPYQLIVTGFSPRWVVITSFKYTYYNDYQIDYDITLEPIDSANVDAVIYSPSSSSSSSSKSSSSSTSKSSSPQRKYTVKSGDTLWKIANKYYGNGALYTKIVSANNIKNPNALKVGQVLIIP
jgi:nucleoid-associated protein YgaU